MSDEQEKRSHSAPNGTEADWSYIFAGREMSAADAKRNEMTLKSDPNNLACRLMLLGFYGQRSGDQEKYFNHMLWMIEERPGDYVSFYLGHEYNSRALIWTKARVRKASDCWEAQVKKHFNDARVLCNAGSFFRWHDQPKSEKLYRRAKKMDTALALPARRLAYQYRFLASKASKEEQAKLVRLALREADDALKRRDSRGEKIGIMTEFAPTAIKFGHLEQARRYAKRLQYYGTGFYLWSQYAYLYLAWIDLRERRYRGLRFKLKRLRELFRAEPSHVASCNAALSLVNDALGLGEEPIAQEILQVLVFGSRSQDDKEKKVELEEWLRAIKTKRKPELNILKKKMSRLF